MNSLVGDTDSQTLPGRGTLSGIVSRSAQKPATFVRIGDGIQSLRGMKSHSDSDGKRPQRRGPQKPIDGANRLVAKFSRLYAQAAPEDQLALRVWMRDIILGRKVGRANTVRARRSEERMIERVSVASWNSLQGRTPAGSPRRMALFSSSPGSRSRPGLPRQPFFCVTLSHSGRAIRRA